MLITVKPSVFYKTVKGVLEPTVKGCLNHMWIFSMMFTLKFVLGGIGKLYFLVIMFILTHL